MAYACPSDGDVLKSWKGLGMGCTFSDSGPGSLVHILYVLYVFKIIGKFNKRQ